MRRPRGDGGVVTKSRFCGAAGHFRCHYGLERRRHPFCGAPGFPGWAWEREFRGGGGAGRQSGGLGEQFFAHIDETDENVVATIFANLSAAKRRVFNPIIEFKVHTIENTGERRFAQGV